MLTDGGITQTFSLLTGKPGTDNIAVLARTHRSDTINQTGHRDLQLLDQGRVRRPRHRRRRQAATVALGGCHAGLSRRHERGHRQRPDKALLIPDVVYTGSHDGGPYGVDTALLTFTPTGGAAIPARNISTDATKIRNVFEVPAGITTGTLTIGGTATETFSSGGGTYTLTVATPMSFPITSRPAEPASGASAASQRTKVSTATATKQERQVAVGQVEQRHRLRVAGRP